MPVFGLNCNANTRRAETVPLGLKLISWGERTGNAFKLTDAAGKLLNKPELVVDDATLRESIDVLISLGGDGTMLNSAHRLTGSARPILGVNTGTLGFLTETPVEELEADMELIVKGDYKIDERMTLVTQYRNEQLPPALNDVVVDRGAVSRIINIDLFAGHEPIASYQADGMIFATPTGSTAYSLSVGGPILAPAMSAIIAAPISAFGFNGRPFVFSDNTEIEVRVHSQHGRSELTIDGQHTVQLPGEASFKVRKGPHKVRLIRFKDSSFYKVLRDKLHWGAPPKPDPE